MEFAYIQALPICVVKDTHIVISIL